MTDPFFCTSGMRNGMNWRTLQQRFLWWRFRLTQRHRHQRLVLETVAGFPLLVLPEVLNPALFHSGVFLARTLNADLIPLGARVLDMGTGSGIVGLSAARWSSDITAADINPEAVRCARINVWLNHLEDRVQVCQSDLFDALPGKQFDVIIFNPPYLEGNPASWFERALYGTGVIQRFAAALPRTLGPGGCVLLLLSSIAHEDGLLQPFREQGMLVTIAAQERWYGEQFTLYRLAYR
jgi:release factor glutamine methyltransferase